MPISTYDHLISPTGKKGAANELLANLLKQHHGNRKKALSEFYAIVNARRKAAGR